MRGRVYIDAGGELYFRVTEYEQLHGVPEGMVDSVTIHEERDSAVYLDMIENASRYAISGGALLKDGEPVALAGPTWEDVYNVSIPILKATDYTQAADTDLGYAERSAWADWRNTWFRHLSSTYANPLDVVWPAGLPSVNGVTVDHKCLLYPDKLWPIDWPW